MQNPNKTSFYERVYEVVRSVPYGKVTSYGAIARYLGTAGSARLVGWAMNKSAPLQLPQKGESTNAQESQPLASTRGREFQHADSQAPPRPSPKGGRANARAGGSGCPAHRVVNRNGMLTGKHHFGGSDVMQQLLESEGNEVIDDKVKNFEIIFWDPMKELK